MPIWLQAIMVVSILGGLQMASRRGSDLICAVLSFLSVVAGVVTELFRFKPFSFFWWTPVILFFLFCAHLAWEYFAPRVRYRWSARQTVKNVAYNYMVFLIGSATYYFISGPHGPALPNVWSMNQQHVPVIVQIAVLLLVIDFVHYVQHWAFHRFDILWRFHKIHHSTQTLNVFTKGAHHSLEVIQEISFDILLVAIFFGPSGVAFVWALGLSQLIKGPLSHANVDFPKLNRKIPIWAHIVYTPNFHAHHHTALGMRVNFGNCFVFWDRFFGTLAIPSATPVVFGISDEAFSEQSALADQLSPFFSTGPGRS